ncbi:MAG: AMP-binding protein [Spirochaetaceae bacterium]|nr:AMP-binding protein [Spirochaetaceae bacterium]
MTAPPDTVLESVAPEGVLDLTALGERYGSAPALQWRGHTVSYREYAHRAARSAAALAVAGVTPSHRVALPADLDPPTWAAALFGVLATGALAVLLPSRAAPRERERLLERTGAVEWRPPSVSASAATGAPLRIFIHRPATVVFTSGSSGEAKAVVHSTANHLYNAAGSAANIPLAPDAAWLVALPLSHVAGLSILFRTLSAGARALFADSGAFLAADDPASRLLPAATHVSLVETQLRRLLQVPGWPALTRRVRAALIGGSALSAPLLRQARDAGLPVCASYGCTEMASQVATTRPGDPRETFADAAPVLPHREVSTSSDGEILLGGRSLCLGYLERERVRPAAGAGGWFASGDLGRLDGNRLSVTGRRDARFISGGENIQPEEVERALLEHPAVLAAVCVAVPDPEFGSRPAAFLSVASGPLPPRDIEPHLAPRLARFKHPVRYFPLPPQPSATGNANNGAIKHSRRTLAARAARTIAEAN